MSSGGKPPYCQTTAITGMSISGRMSVGIWRIEKIPATTMSIAMTTKVYGRRSARRTSHMVELDFGSGKVAGGREQAQACLTCGVGGGLLLRRGIASLLLG